MTILVDEARWEWRGERWAHLVSDVSLDELHDFARALGLRYLSFQGDHYDLARPRRQDAIDMGAAPVSSRELVRRLVAAGLRRRGARSDTAWSQLARWPAPGIDAELLVNALAPVLVGRAREAARAVVDASRSVEADHVALFHRPGEAVALLSGGRRDVAVPTEPPGIDLVNDTVDGGRRLLELVVRGPAPAGYRHVT